jgi:hypothetical protein
MSATNGEALVSAINQLLVRLDTQGVSANEIVACIKPLIADSEAAAVAKIRAERDQLLAILVYADRILDDIDTCSDAHKPMYSSYSQNVFKLCIKGRDARRAAIDAAMKESAK